MVQKSPGTLHLHHDAMPTLGRSVWWIEGISNFSESGLFGTIALGFSKERRYRARKGSPRTNCW